jgi:Arc/MetJ-type ribon-helix-helix transcriptional regulator
MGRRITLELPDHLVERLDELKKEWCIRSRGDCLTRLLEEIWTDETDLENGVDDLLENGTIEREWPFQLQPQLLTFDPHQTSNPRNRLTTKTGPSF